MEEKDLDDLEEESDDEDTAEARPYMALIKSLTEESGAPSAKRRKLDHHEAPSEAPKDEPAEPEKEAEEDPDFVEEPEETLDEADTEGVFDYEDDDEDEKVDLSDPFDSHFVAIDEASLARRLRAVADGKWTTKKAGAKGSRTVLNSPDTGDDSDQMSVPSPVLSAAELPLKHKLLETGAVKKMKFDAVEQSLAPYVFGYTDLLYCNRTTANGESLRRLACLHALNHVFKYVLLLPVFLKYTANNLAEQETESSRTTPN